MLNIAIAGGTGGIGRTLVEVLKQNPAYEVFVLSRKKVDPTDSVVVDVSYDDISGLKDTLEKLRIHTVISTFPIEDDAASAAEISLIKAADMSGPTVRIITSSWAIPMPDSADLGGFPNYPQRSIDVAKATNLEYTTVYNGCFMDYYGLPHIKSYLKHIDFGIDIANKFAAIPGTGNESFVLTYSFDIAKVIDIFLAFDSGSWPHQTWIVGDRVTFKEILAAAEEVRRTKFAVAYDDADKLKSYQITALPSHTLQCSSLQKEQLQMTLAWSGLLVVDGAMDFPNEKSLNKKLPSIKMKTMKELVHESWNGQ